MQPMVLRFTFHQQQAAMRKFYCDSLGGGFVFESKCALCAEAERGNAGVVAERCFIVAVPCHALLSIGVEVEQARVEACVGDALNVLFE